MTHAQLEAKRKAAGAKFAKTCKAKLGSDRCTLIEGHRERTHTAIGPTGAKLRWTVGSAPPPTGA